MFLLKLCVFFNVCSAEHSPPQRVSKLFKGIEIYTSISTFTTIVFENENFKYTTKMRGKSRGYNIRKTNNNILEVFHKNYNWSIIMHSSENRFVAK